MSHSLSRIALGRLLFSLFKSKEITISDQQKQNLVKILTNIVEILRENGYQAQVEAVKRPLYELLNNDKDNKEFLTKLFSVDVYGGAGAAWEVARFNTKENEIQFSKCFIELNETLVSCDIKDKRAKQIATFFKSNLSDNSNN